MMQKNLLRNIFIFLALPLLLGGAKVQFASLIYGGSQVKRGTFPWMVALRLFQFGSYQYICGGTIISDRSIVTAAHCLQQKGSTEIFDLDKIQILAGVHDLENDNEEGRKTLTPSRIHIHEDWKPLELKKGIFDADIAILELQNKLSFTEYIKPISLKSSKEDEVADSKYGFIVGYGKSEDPKIHETLPRVINVPIVDKEECLYSNKDLVDLSSRRTACIGKRDGTGACFGDSGHGMFVEIDSTYYLRGIVSGSLKDEGNCDLSNYQLITDIPKYLEWISLKKPKVHHSRDFRLILKKGTVFHICGSATTIRKDVEKNYNCDGHSIVLIVKSNNDLINQFDVHFRLPKEFSNVYSYTKQENVLSSNVTIYQNIFSCNNHSKLEKDDGPLVLYQHFGFNTGVVDRCTWSSSRSQTITAPDQTGARQYNFVDNDATNALVEQFLIHTPEKLRTPLISVGYQFNKFYTSSVVARQVIEESFLKAVQFNYFFDGNDESNLYLDVESTPYSMQLNFRYKDSKGRSIFVDRT